MKHVLDFKQLFGPTYTFLKLLTYWVRLSRLRYSESRSPSDLFYEPYHTRISLKLVIRQLSHILISNGFKLHLIECNSIAHNNLLT